MQKPPKSTKFQGAYRRPRLFRVVLWLVFFATLASGFSATTAAALPTPALAAPSVSKQDLEKALADVKSQLKAKEAALVSAVGEARDKLLKEIKVLKEAEGKAKTKLTDYVNVYNTASQARGLYNTYRNTFWGGTTPFNDSAYVDFQKAGRKMFEAEAAAAAKSFDLPWGSAVKKAPCASGTYYSDVSSSVSCSAPLVAASVLEGFKKKHPSQRTSFTEKTREDHKKSLASIDDLMNKQLEWLKQGVGGLERNKGKDTYLMLGKWKDEIQGLLDEVEKKLKEDKDAEKAAADDLKTKTQNYNFDLSAKRTNVAIAAKKDLKNDDNFKVWQAALKSLYDLEQKALADGVSVTLTVEPQIKGGKIDGFIPLDPMLGCGDNCGKVSRTSTPGGLSLVASPYPRTDPGTGPWCTRYREQLVADQGNQRRTAGAPDGGGYDDSSTCKSLIAVAGLNLKAQVSGAAINAVEKGAVWYQVVARDNRTTTWTMMFPDGKGGFNAIVPETFPLDFSSSYKVRIAATLQRSIAGDMQRSGTPSVSCTTPTQLTNCVLASEEFTVATTGRPFTPIATTTTTTVPKPTQTTVVSSNGGSNGGSNGSQESTSDSPGATFAPETRVGRSANGPGGGSTIEIAQGDLGTGVTDAKQTLFGRFYSSQGASIGKVDVGSTSPPISCIGVGKNSEPRDACFIKYSASPEQLLPAWRWREHVSLYTNVPGMDGIPALLYSFLASTAFTFSQLVWWMLLEVTQWSLTDNLVERAGSSMNRGYLLFVDLLNSSGIFLLLAALGLFTIARLFLRGRLVKVFSMVLAFIIPIALMQGLAVQAAQTGKGERTSWGDEPLPTASPAWFAVRGVNVVDGFSTWISSGLGRLSTVSGSLQIQEASAVDPSCSSYVAAMYDQYYAYSSAPIRNIKDEAARKYRAGFESLQNAYTSSSSGSAERWGLVAPALAGPLEYNAVQASKPVSMENWQAMLAGRSINEKLSDARFYKVATVSQLWHRAFLGSWQSAQFGNQAYGARMYCHMLESNADIDPLEQAAIASIAGRYSYVLVGTGNEQTMVPSIGYDGISLGAFERGTTSLDREQRILAWAACSRVLNPSTGDWEWKASPGWSALGNGKGVNDKDCHSYFFDSYSNATKVRNLFANGAASAVTFFTSAGCGFGSAGNAAKTALTLGGNCVLGAVDGAIKSIPVVGKFLSVSAWGERIADGLTPDPFGQLKFKDNEEVDKSVAAAAAEAGQAGKDAGQAYATAKDAGKTVLSLKGHNGPQRLTLGILALITSFLYAYAIGFLALGTFFAKIGLVIMIILLPGTLLMLAVPSARTAGDGGAQKMGQKMLRMTAGFVLSHGMLSFVLGLLLSVMLVFESVIGGTGQGVGGGFVHGLIPIAALFVVRTVLKAVGLGDIASAQGALGMPLSAALRAGGRDMQALGMRSFAAATNKAGLDRFDAAAKRVGKRAALAVPKFAGRTAAKWGKKLGKAAGDRLGLPEAKRWLLGERDPVTGAMRSHGLASRVKTLAGLVGLANSARKLDQKALRKLGITPALAAVGGRLAATSGGRRIGRAGAWIWGNGVDDKRLGATFNAFKNRPGIRKLVQDDGTIRRETRRSRQDWLRVVGRSKNKRADLRKDFANHKKHEHFALDLADREPEGPDKGKIIRTADGKPVYAYKTYRKVVKADGTVITDDTGRDLFALEAIDAAGRPSRISLSVADARPGLTAQKDAAGVEVKVGGESVYGYRLDDGKSVRVLSQEEYDEKVAAGLDPSSLTPVFAADKDKYKEGVRYVYDREEGKSLLRKVDVLAISDDAVRAEALASPLTDPEEFRKFFTEDEIWPAAEEFREDYGLHPGQFLVSAYSRPVLRPALGDANGKHRFVITKNLQTTYELAAFERTQYLVNHQKARLPGETDAQQAIRLRLHEEWLGGFGPDGEKPDIVFERTGHKWDSPRGQHELQLALEGKECALTSWEAEIPPEVFQAQVMASKTIADEEVLGKATKDLYAEVARVRDEMMSEAHMTVVSADSAVTAKAAMFNEIGNLMASIPSKMKPLKLDLATRTSEQKAIRQGLVDVATELAAARAAADKARIKAAEDLERDLLIKDLATEDEIKKLNKVLDEFKAELLAHADRSKTLATEILEESKIAESAGKTLQYGHLALKRDKGTADGSEIDGKIDDDIKEMMGRWAALETQLSSHINAMIDGAEAREGQRTKTAYENLNKLVDRTAAAASAAATSGSGYHLKIVRDLAMMEGDSRSTDSSSTPSVRNLLSRTRRG